MKKRIPPNHRPRLSLILGLAAFLSVAAPFPASAGCQQGCDSTNYNSFLGIDALINNATGSVNTASGSDALYSNTGGSENVASGFSALYSNTTGNNNVATGVVALNPIRLAATMSPPVCIRSPQTRLGTITLRSVRTHW